MIKTLYGEAADDASDSEDSSDDGDGRRDSDFNSALRTRSVLKEDEADLA